MQQILSEMENSYIKKNLATDAEDWVMILPDEQWKHE